jgi:hypothetical protein
MVSGAVVTMYTDEVPQCAWFGVRWTSCALERFNLNGPARRCTRTIVVEVSKPLGKSLTRYLRPDYVKATVASVQVRKS